MAIRKSILFAILSYSLISLTSCSFFRGSKDKSKEAQEQASEAEAAFGLDDLDDTNEDFGSTDDSNQAEDDALAEDLFSDDGNNEVASNNVEDDLFAEEGEENLFGDESVPSDSGMADISGSQGQSAVDGSGRYTVVRGDTLMWIAYKIYGDYSQWRRLANANGGTPNISTGMTLNYDPPTNSFMMPQNGTPYLIMEGDTLGKISNRVYNTSQKWKDIWNNNRPMIKNPNLIFAGFTLYYRPQDDLMASLH